MRVKYEVDLRGTRVDVEWRDKSGRLTFLNIGVSDPQREAGAALKAMALPVVSTNTFALVARDSAFARTFEQAMKARDAQGALRAQVQVRLIADHLDL